MKPDLLRHLAGEKIGRFPVWMMRQAGRYLPSYREIRQKHSFWEMVTKPEIASKVSVLPREVIAVDGIILFSDILTPSYGMGIKIEMEDSIGPVIQSPLLTRSAFEVFEKFDPGKHTAFVGEALNLIRRDLDPSVALIGFAGAPWTVGSYLTEGHLKKRQFKEIKGWMFRSGRDLADSLSILGRSTTRYLLSQVKEGAQIVQLFDTWLSEMPKSFFETYYLDILNETFEALRKAGVPSIYFSKNAHHLLPSFKTLKADVISVDSSWRFPEVDQALSGKFSLQGNLDPLILLGTESTVRNETRRLVGEARELKRPSILNLAHGIFPETPVQNAKAFIEEARALWI